jgi:hypothetical protein
MKFVFTYNEVRPRYVTCSWPSWWITKANSDWAVKGEQYSRGLGLEFSQMAWFNGTQRFISEFLTPYPEPHKSHYYFPEIHFNIIFSIYVEVSQVDFRTEGLRPCFLWFTHESRLLFFFYLL